jgi:hypothetical protein
MYRTLARRIVPIDKMRRVVLCILQNRFRIKFESSKREPGYALLLAFDEHFHSNESRAWRIPAVRPRQSYCILDFNIISNGYSSQGRQ